MTKEIGGYLGLEEYSHKEYYPNLVALNTARNSLLYIIESRRIRHLFIPYYLCDSVSTICQQHGVKFDFYHIGKDFLPIADVNLEDNDFIYIVNFFGQLSDEILHQLKCKYTNIIIDNVQAFYQKPLLGMDTLYSCRKFFGVPDGSYLSTDVVIDQELEVDVSKDRMKHILGRYEGNASDYYADFVRNDDSFDDLPLRKMSKLTHNLLGAVDYQSVKMKRNNNYKILENELDGLNKLGFHEPVGPFCYPFYCSNGLLIKKELAKRNIFIPTLWPNVLHGGGGDIFGKKLCRKHPSVAL